MAWYRNAYYCNRCDEGWEDEWSCACDDECPNCGRPFESYHSRDLSGPKIETNGFIHRVTWSPPEAEETASWRVRYFANRGEAESFAATVETRP